MRYPSYLVKRQVFHIMAVKVQYRRADRRLPRLPPIRPEAAQQLNQKTVDYMAHIHIHILISVRHGGILCPGDERVQQSLRGSEAAPGKIRGQIRAHRLMRQYLFIDRRGYHPLVEHDPDYIERFIDVYRVTVRGGQHINLPL